MSEALVLLGIFVAAMSGFAGLFGARNSTAGQRLTTALAIVGALLGISGIVTFWATGISQPIVWPWSIPGAEFNVGIDGLSAIFLAPIFLISLLGNIYGLGYWKQSEHPESGRKLRLFYGTLTAGMALLVVARNSIVFLFGWEIMAVSAFFLVATDDDQAEVREAAWVYLVAAHTATLCLFAAFALLHAATGSFTLVAQGQGHVPTSLATPIFLLSIAGFGLKAGIMPFHVWLPGAHAAAPSHVSAFMSGVLIKMGIYGLLRVTSLLGTPPVYFGGVLLGLGAVSGVLGVAFAIGQHDLKRLLAYHSIENIGIIVMGIGLAMIGRSLGRADCVVLGLAGGLLHVWNHSLFKALLFLSAGSVIHAVHTREIDHLGGLARAMPWTSLSFLVGSVAICGLPPLNGFVSEFLIYLGLFATVIPGAGASYPGAAFAAPALALIGALAVACFVKVYGAVFLGNARSEQTRHAHEAPLSMLGPMGVLAACCVVIGTAPLLVAPILEPGVAAWDPGMIQTAPRLTVLAPLESVTVMGLLLIALGSLVGWLLSAWLRRTVVNDEDTWGCGYLAPSSSMQYTSSSFAQMLVALFGWALRPRSHRPGSLAIFPREARFHSDVPDVVLDQAVLPALRRGALIFAWFRVLQRGNVQIYLVYMFVALIVLLLWR